MANNYKPKIVIVGSFIMDLVVQTHRAPKAGESIIGTKFSTFTGGKGANQAVASARLGADVTMIGKVGKDSFGDQRIESMKNADINTNYIFQDGSSFTGVGSITLEDNGQNRIVVVPGANLNLKVNEIEDLEKVIAKHDILILQFEIPMEVNEKCVEIANKHNIKVILNPAPAGNIPHHLFSKLDYIIPNESETELMTGITVTDINSARLAAKKLKEMGTLNIIITLGKIGVFYLGKDNIEYFIPSIKVAPVDTTAAGDAFIGSFAYHLASGFDIKETLRMANIVAGISVTRLGAQASLPSREQVDNFISKEKL